MNKKYPKRLQSCFHTKICKITPEQQRARDIAIPIEWRIKHPKIQIGKTLPIGRR